MAALGTALSACAPVFAQDSGEPAASPAPLQHDIKAAIEAEEEDEGFEACEEDQDAAALTGEIIVCRKRTGDEHRLYDKEAAERRHAERTAFKGDPKTPDFILDCKEQGMPVGCFAMGGVPEKVYMIDFSALPDTPPGSDAERAAQGLAPRSQSANSDGSVTIAAGAPPAQPEAVPER